MISAAMSPRLHKQIRYSRTKLTHPAARAYFLDPAGEAWPVGHLLVNKPLAAMLRAVAESWADAFYTGAVAADIAHAVSTAPQQPSPVTPADLASYQATPRPPVCVSYRRHEVCGMGPSFASTRSSTESTIDRMRSTSPEKSAWPGVSTMLIR